MKPVDFHTNYEKSLFLARDIASNQLKPHIGFGGDDSLEDLAQSIVGTEEVIELLTCIMFDEQHYRPVMERAADEVGRQLFPDSRKRFISSLDHLPDHLLTTDPPGLPDEDDTVADGDGISELDTGFLEPDLREYFDTIVETLSGVWPHTVLLRETQPDVLVKRLRRLRRHYPDGCVTRCDEYSPHETLPETAIIEIARGVASGLRVAFPFGFFTCQTEERIAVSVRYIVTHELQCSPNEVLKQGESRLVSLGLGSALRRCGGSVNRLLAFAFPEDIRPWMSSHVPHGYWDMPENRIDAVKWLVECRLKITPTEIGTAVHTGRITKKEFSETGLTWLLKNVYKWSVARALLDAYPQLHPWQISRRIAKETWIGDSGGEHARCAITWALRQEAVTCDDLRTPDAGRLVRQALKTWHVSGALTIGYGGDIVSALEDVYPGEFHRWEICRMPRRAWEDEELRREATCWLVDRLHIAVEDIPDAIASGLLTPASFREAGLDGVLRVTGSVWKAVNEAYPGRFCRWELGAVPKSFWTRETINDAAERVLDSHRILPWDAWAAFRDGVLTEHVLAEMGLGSLLRDVFRGDPCRLCGSNDVLRFHKRADLSLHRHRRPEEELPVRWRRQLARRSPGRRFPVH